MENKETILGSGSLDSHYNSIISHQSKNVPAIDPFWSRRDFPATSVHCWALLVQLPNAKPYAEELVVYSVDLCKAAGGFQHEFLIISLRHRSKNLTTCFLVERGQTLGTQPHFPFNLFRMIHLTFGHSLASDLVFIPANGLRTNIEAHAERTYGSYRILATLRPTRDVSATQLSILLNIPGDLAPNYNIHSYQCYWYADGMYKAIQYLSQGIEESNVDAKDRGKMHGLSALTTKSLAVKVLLRDFDQKWAAFCNLRT